MNPAVVKEIRTRRFGRGHRPLRLMCATLPGYYDLLPANWYAVGAACPVLVLRVRRLCRPE